MSKPRNLFADMFLGAVAGGVGVWVMGQVDEWLYEQESEASRTQAEAARIDGQPPADVAANRALDTVTEKTGVEIGDTPRQTAGIATHYALGVVPAMLFAALRPVFPMVDAGAGLLFGVATWLFEDELMGPALGIAAPPQRYPWQAHARGLVAHLVFGTVTSTMLRVLAGRNRPIDLHLATDAAAALANGLAQARDAHAQLRDAASDKLDRWNRKGNRFADRLGDKADDLQTTLAKKARRYRAKADGWAGDLGDAADDARSIWSKRAKRYAGQASDLADRAAGLAADRADKAQDRLGQRAGRLADRARDTRDELGDQAEALQGKLAKRARIFGGKAKDWRDDVQARTEDALEDLADTVHDTLDDIRRSGRKAWKKLAA